MHSSDGWVAEGRQRYHLWLVWSKQGECDTAHTLIFLHVWLQQQQQLLLQQGEEEVEEDEEEEVLAMTMVVVVVAARVRCNQFSWRQKKFVLLHESPLPTSPPYPSSSFPSVKTDSQV
ncbi:hypothetical protein TcWFU_008664 [Taenia crassiceps]|uniref:Uncharacterized protein n=1 Tax=Taenia crassiceps TaxID=6207 RepID=A0ABR4QEC8_9CEST